MILNEIFEKSPEAFQDLSKDNSQPNIGSLRKTHLTLAQLRKLRQLNDIRQVEMEEKLEKVRKQYMPAEQPMM
jgi:hypothetical protein